MDILILAASQDTPAIVLDPEHGVFEISGKSLPQNAGTFYDPVLHWLEEYAKKPNATTDFSFKFDFYNTSTSKIILDILYVLDEIPGARVLWYFHDEDEDMEEAGEEFSELVDLPFSFQEY